MPHYASLHLYKRHSDTYTTLSLDRSVYTVGRRDTCDIRLQLPQVSKHHCTLAADDQYRVHLTNHSVNGIYINDRLVRGNQPVLLQTGDCIRILDRQFRFVYATGYPRKASESDKEVAATLSPPAAVSGADTESASKVPVATTAVIAPSAETPRAARFARHSSCKTPLRDISRKGETTHRLSLTTTSAESISLDTSDATLPLSDDSDASRYVSSDGLQGGPIVDILLSAELKSPVETTSLPPAKPSSPLRFEFPAGMASSLVVTPGPVRTPTADLPPPGPSTVIDTTPLSTMDTPALTDLVNAFYGDTGPVADGAPTISNLKAAPPYPPETPTASHTLETQKTSLPFPPLPLSTRKSYPVDGNTSGIPDTQPASDGEPIPTQTPHRDGQTPRAPRSPHKPGPDATPLTGLKRMLRGSGSDEEDSPTVSHHPFRGSLSDQSHGYTLAGAAAPGPTHGKATTPPLTERDPDLTTPEARTGPGATVSTFRGLRTMVRTPYVGINPDSPSIADTPTYRRSHADGIALLDCPITTPATAKARPGTMVHPDPPAQSMDALLKTYLRPSVLGTPDMAKVRGDVAASSDVIAEPSPFLTTQPSPETADVGTGTAMAGDGDEHSDDTQRTPPNAGPAHHSGLTGVRHLFRTPHVGNQVGTGRPAPPSVKHSHASHRVVRVIETHADMGTPTSSLVGVRNLFATPRARHYNLATQDSGAGQGDTVRDTVGPPFSSPSPEEPIPAARPVMSPPPTTSFRPRRRRRSIGAVYDPRDASDLDTSSGSEDEDSGRSLVRKRRRNTLEPHLIPIQSTDRHSSSLARVPYGLSLTRIPEGGVNAPIEEEVREAPTECNLADPIIPSALPTVLESPTPLPHDPPTAPLQLGTPASVRVPPATVCAVRTVPRFNPFQPAVSALANQPLFTRTVGRPIVISTFSHVLIESSPVPQRQTPTSTLSTHFPASISTPTPAPRPPSTLKPPASGLPNGSLAPGTQDAPLTAASTFLTASSDTLRPQSPPITILLSSSPPLPSFDSGSPVLAATPVRDRGQSQDKAHDQERGTLHKTEPPSSLSVCTSSTEQISTPARRRPQGKARSRGQGALPINGDSNSLSPTSMEPQTQSDIDIPDQTARTNPTVVGPATGPVAPDRGDRKRSVPTPTLSDNEVTTSPPKKRRTQARKVTKPTPAADALAAIISPLTTRAGRARRQDSARGPTTHAVLPGTSLVFEAVEIISPRPPQRTRKVGPKGADAAATPPLAKRTRAGSRSIVAVPVPEITEAALSKPARRGRANSKTAANTEEVGTKAPTRRGRKTPVSDGSTTNEQGQITDEPALPTSRGRKRAATPVPMEDHDVATSQPPQPGPNRSAEEEGE
ncbi:antigen identified by monoclonal antibody Ki-67, partial [Tieghemiomyces parasiticus]